MSRPGRKFVEECTASLKAIGARVWSLDNIGGTGEGGPKRMGDLEACVPPGGRSVLLECKECLATDSLRFDRVAAHQMRWSVKQCRSGGVGLVLVKWQAGRAARVFACTGTDWLDLLAQGTGVDPDTILRESKHRSEWQALLARLPRKGKSVPLADGKRPACLVEVPRRRVGESLVWDLREVLGLAGGVGEVAA